MKLAVVSFWSRRWRCSCYRQVCANSLDTLQFLYLCLKASVVMAERIFSVISALPWITPIRNGFIRLFYTAR